MRKVGLYTAAAICGLLGLIGVLRLVETLIFEGRNNASAYGAGRLTGHALLAALFLLLCRKAYSKAHAVRS